MKRIIFICLFACIGKMNFAQTDTSFLYLRFPNLPPLSVIKVSDSTKFTKDDLKKNTATLIFIFSPDCSHCQHETEKLLAHINLFKKVQIVMSSPIEYVYLKKFYDEYKIADYPNITMGMDPGYFLGTFYHIRSFPALYLYDKKGNFLKAFDGSVPVEEIAAAL